MAFLSRPRTETVLERGPTLQARCGPPVSLVFVFRLSLSLFLDISIIYTVEIDFRARDFLQKTVFRTSRAFFFFSLGQQFRPRAFL